MSAASAVLVWTWPVRIAHWCVAALIVFNLFNDSGGKIHRYAGYAAAAFVVARGLYGLFQRGQPAGLHIPTPVAGFRHLREMFSGRPSRPAGHNALGAAMALLLWTLVLGLAVTGFISRMDAYWGEDWPIDIHIWLSTTLQIAVLLHILGVIISSLLERQNLAMAMITGRKMVDSAELRDNER